MKPNKYIYNFQMAEKESKKEIIDTFDRRHMEVFVRAVNKAYKWIDVWLQDPNNTPLVINGRKKFTRGLFIGPAVDYFLVKEIMDEGLDLKVKSRFNSRGFPYLVISDEKQTFELTINQTQKIDATANSAVFRDELIDKYQSRLFLIEDEVNKELSKTYFQLTHGYQTEVPAYINLGIPDPNKNGKWKDYIDISRLPQIVRKTTLKTTVSRYEVPDLSKMQEFINEVVENE